MVRILFDNLSSVLDVYYALAHIYYIGTPRRAARSILRRVIMSAAITVSALGHVHSFRLRRNVKARGRGMKYASVPIDNYAT